MAASRRLALKVIAAAAVAPGSRPGACRRPALAAHARLGLLQPGEPRPEGEGLARGGAQGRTASMSAGCRAWARTRRSSSSTPARSTSARPPAPPRCWPGSTATRSVRLRLLQARVDGAGHPARHRHRQGRGSEGQADRRHQGHRPLHLPPARAGRCRPGPGRRAARPAAARPGRAWPSSAATSTPGPASTR